MQMKKKLRTGDEVIVISGKDKGRKGKVTKIDSSERIYVENVNMVKKHTKGNPTTGAAGGIIEKEAPLHVSNVMIFNPATGKGDKVGFTFLEDGKKVRVFKSNKEVIDI